MRYDTEINHGVHITQGGMMLSFIDAPVCTLISVR